MNSIIPDIGPVLSDHLAVNANSYACWRCEGRYQHTEDIGNMLVFVWVTIAQSV